MYSKKTKDIDQYLWKEIVWWLC